MLVAILAAAVVYSEITAKKYITDLQASANTLRSAVQVLEGSVDSPLLNDPSASTSTRTADAQKLKGAIASYKAELKDFSVKSEALPSLPYAVHIGTFATAKTYQERSRHVINQTNDTLSRYDETISFLEVYATSLEKSTKITEEFNAIHNFNDYSGQSAYFRQMAANIQKEADALSTQKAPTELLTMKDSTIQNLRQLTTQLNGLAYGMDVAVDDIIYGSVRDIESTNTQLNTLADTTYGQTTNKLRAVQEIYDINEKLDLILP